MQSAALEYLVTIKRTGSIQKASKILFTSPQNVSKVLKNLENELGMTLVECSAKGTRFTMAGEKLYEIANNFLEQLEDFKTNYAAGEQRDEHIHGEVTIIASPHQTLYFLNDLLLEFRKNYPQIRIMLLSAKTNDIFAEMENNSKQLAICYRLDDAADWNYPKWDQEKFQFLALNHDRLIAITSKGNLLSRQKSISWKKLADQNVIVLKSRSALEDAEPLLVHIFNTLALKFSKEPIYTDNFSTYLEGIAQGWVGISSENSCKHNRLLSQEDICILTLQANVNFTNYLISQKDVEYDAATQKFMEFINGYIR